MIIDKNLTVDLNRIAPLKVIKIHEGDVNSVRLVLSITQNSESVDLSNVAVKYDATIANILAEQNATGTIDGSNAIIPITSNMTATSGILKIDVKFVAGTSVLHTQTLTLIVEKSIIDDSTIIDASGTSIIQKLHEFELQIDGLTNNYYTKAESDSLLAGKEGYEYHQGITLADCDNYTDSSKIYRLYIDGTYQLLICTSQTGAQYRFTKWGDVYYRYFNIGSQTWGDWKSVSAKIPDNTIVTAMLADSSVTYDKLDDDYCRTVGTFDLNHINDDNTFGVHTGAANEDWTDLFDVTGDFLLFNVLNKQFVMFPASNKFMYRVRGSRGAWGNWQETTYATVADVQTMIAGKANSATTLAGYGITDAYTKTNVDTKLSAKANTATTLSGYGITDAYTKANIDTLLAGREKTEYHSATWADCDEYTNADTIYRLYIDGSYHVLICTSPTGCQYRFTRFGVIYRRTYNTTTSSWRDWVEIGSISAAEVQGMIDTNLANYYTKTEADTLLGGKANSATSLSGYGITDAYTKTEVNNLTTGKVKFVYHNGVALADCDNYTDWDTIYHLHIDGAYQILMNSSVNGGQYRFLRNGNIYTREFINNAWTQWKHITALIPDGTITGNMIDYGTITYDNMSDHYFRYFYGQNLDDINNIPVGIYIGDVTSAWTSRYSVTGKYFLLSADSQLLFFPNNNLFLWRSRGVGGVWNNWDDAQFVTAVDVNSAVCGEEGTIGTNYAWYTDSSQGYSMTGNYTLVGNYCVLHGTAPLISGWERVYYSLPVAAVKPSAVIALCGNNTYSVATGTQNSISVLEIKQIGSSSMSSGTVSFTLVYKYQ